jgi:2,3-bisphosphoglycerate-independent phosphoglycerate mutase
VLLVTMTEYESGLPVDVAFPPEEAYSLAHAAADAGWRQFHVAETEKYAHVTYFFNGGREAPLPGEDRKLVPSPKVATYDLDPAMSASGVTDALIAAVETGSYDLIVANFANPDMVGHTGVWAAAVEAVETVDACLGRVVEAVGRLGGVCLVTADHGNAEKLLEDDGVSPHTAHTTNLVPLILTAPGFSLQEGELSDLAPTILALLGFESPRQMSGRNVVANSQ